MAGIAIDVEGGRRRARPTRAARRPRSSRRVQTVVGLREAFEVGIDRPPGRRDVDRDRHGAVDAEGARPADCRRRSRRRRRRRRRGGGRRCERRGPLDAGGPRSWVPTTRATTTAAAPRPMGTILFMVGNLHGPMTTRCCVPSIRSRTASNDGSGSSVGPSRRKASSCRSSSCCVVMRIAPRDRRVPGHRPRGRRGALVWRDACGTSRSRVGCRVARPPRVAEARGSGGRPARRAVRR